MPNGYGKGRGLGRGRGRNRQRRIINFLRPCILLALSNGKAHGYNLISEIEKFGFDPSQFDASLIYRSLRDMEERGFVQSTWDETESRGPQRRVYQITDQGVLHLDDWIVDLKRVRIELDAVLQAYENSKS